MQRAVEILTAEYPRLVATLEELKAAFTVMLSSALNVPLRMSAIHHC